MIICKTRGKGQSTWKRSVSMIRASRCQAVPFLAGEGEAEMEDPSSEEADRLVRLDGLTKER